MARHDKTCRQCTEPFATRWRKQEYCEECQILRALNWGLAPCNCETCDRKYWPLKKTHTQCPSCNQITTITSKTVSPCHTCGEPIRTAPGLTRACLACVTKSEHSRKQYHKHLRKRLDEKLKETS